MIITNDFSQTIKWKQKWDQVILPENCQPDSNCKEENPPREEFEFNMWAKKILFMQNFLLCLSQRQLCLNSYINYICASPMEQLCWHSQQTYPKKNIKLISRITALGQEIISLESWFWNSATILSFSLAENKLMFDYDRNVWTMKKTFWNGMNELNAMICVWAEGRELTKTVVEEKEDVDL